MPSKEFQIERAGERREQDVLALLADYLPGTDVRARYDWLYAKNPHGRSVTVVAYDPTSGEPVGLTSVFPRRVRVDGRSMRGSIGGDGYVKPSHRRRGIATALHDASRAAMREEGIDFMFGPPEPNNLKALVRAGARIVTKVRRFARPLAVQRLERLLHATRPSLRAKLVPLVELGPAAIARALERAADGYRVVPERDPAQYAWRYDAPSHAQTAFGVLERGEVLALAALERRGDHVGIVDVAAPRDALAHTLRVIARASAAESLSMRSVERGPVADALFRAGFFPREARPFQVFATEGRNAPPAVFDPDGWHYTWGDGDVDSVL
jgi:GNAT superfamily N-acetyltransferase